MNRKKTPKWCDKCGQWSDECGCHERGQALSGYALGIAGVAIAAVAALIFMGGGIGSVADGVACELDGLDGESDPKCLTAEASPEPSLEPTPEPTPEPPPPYVAGDFNPSGDDSMPWWLEGSYGLDPAWGLSTSAFPGYACRVCHDGNGDNIPDELQIDGNNPTGAAVYGTVVKRNLQNMGASYRYDGVDYDFSDLPAYGTGCYSSTFNANVGLCYP